EKQQVPAPFRYQDRRSHHGPNVGIAVDDGEELLGFVLRALSDHERQTDIAILHARFEHRAIGRVRATSASRNKSEARPVTPALVRISSLLTSFEPVSEIAAMRKPSEFATVSRASLHQLTMS